MELGNYFSIWNKLTPGQRERIEASSEFRKAKKGTILHNGSMDCLGLMVIKSGQLRSYMLSPDGREITINRLFEMDVCLFSASCVMPSMQFEVIIEAEKDSELWIIPACLFKDLMEESIVISNYCNELISSHFSELMWLVSYSWG